MIRNSANALILFSAWSRFTAGPTLLVFSGTSHWRACRHRSVKALIMYLQGYELLLLLKGSGASESATIR